VVQKTNWRWRVGAALWVFCAQFFVAEQLASHAWPLPYSFIRNYISDLGAIHCGLEICSPWHQLMNVSFVLQGFLIGAGSLCMWTRFPGIGKLSLALLMICAGGVALVGLAPTDSNAQAHTIGATVHFVAAGLGIVAMGIAQLREGTGRRPGYLSVLTGAAILMATASLGNLKFMPGQTLQMAGAIERVGAYGIVLWLIAMGCQGLIRATHPARLPAILPATYRQG
jgi:hypothetical membrane protein